MKKHVVKVWDLPSSGTGAVLLILSVAFFLGGLAGCLLADRVGGSGSEALADYLKGYLSSVYSENVIKPDILALLWETVRWPLFALALGLTPLGLLGVPILFLVRGFLLSFSIASFFRVLGVEGLILAFVIFGITGLIALPVFFVLGIQSFLSAGAITGRLLGESRKQMLIDRIALLRCGMCAAALCASAFVEYCVVPVLLGSLSGIFQGS